MKIELRKEVDKDFTTWYRVYAGDKYMYGSTASSSAKEYYDKLVKEGGVFPEPVVMESTEIITSSQ